MGLASKVIFVSLRLGEMACAIIVLGLLSRFLSRVGAAGVYADSRLIYTEVIACISTLFSLLFILPFYISCLAFPIDFILFSTWLVAFCLQLNLTGLDIDNSAWYWSYWGFYWGGFWRNSITVHGPADIKWAGYGSWRTVLAFSFLASIAYLCSSFLGGYVVLQHRENRRSAPDRSRHLLKQSPGIDPENRGVSEGLTGTTTVATAAAVPTENSPAS